MPEVIHRAGSRFGDWLRRMAKRHYTAIGVGIVALVAGGLGWTFATDYRVRPVPSFQVAFRVDPMIWGTVWIGIAVILIALAVASLRDTSELGRAVWPLVIQGTSWCVFAACNAITVQTGAGIPTGVWAYSGLGFLTYFVALGAYFAGDDDDD